MASDSSIIALDQCLQNSQVTSFTNKYLLPSQITKQELRKNKDIFRQNLPHILFRKLLKDLLHQNDHTKENGQERDEVFYFLLQILCDQFTCRTSVKTNPKS